MQLIDLSHTIETGMSLFADSAPQPKISAWMSHADSAETGNYTNTTCEISQIQMLTSIGTYLDSPYHFNPNLPSIEQLTLEQLVLEGIVIDCTQSAVASSPLPAHILDGVDVQDKAVLFRTDWSQYWGQSQYNQFPFLTRSIAERLRDGGAKLAGVDFLVADDTTDPTRPVHVTLLNNHVLIVENLTNLALLPRSDFTFHAVPAKIAGVAAFPVRAYATF